MKSSARWTTAIATAACLALPVAGRAQTPPTSQSPTSQQQPSTQKQPSTTAGQQSGEAQEHLHQAQAALKDVPTTIPAPAKSKVAELKRHLNALEKSSAASGSTAAKSAASKNTWSKDVAAIDKILTELLGPASGSSASEPTGTTGATSQSRSTTAMTLDETTKSKLMEVRTHVTAFAAAMSGTSGPSAASSSPEPSAATDPASAAATQPPSSQASSSQPGSSQPSSQQPSDPAQQSPQPSAPPSAEPTQQPPTASAGQQADPEASKRHLTAARESLSELTQLPAAAQLTGEPRTQVSQLISNFNELITTKENWREAYNKVEANVTALLGPETSGETAQAPPAAQPGAAVGTTGTTATSIDPAIRAKLVEFRTHLKQFEQAAGVSDQASMAQSSTPASTPSEPAASTPTGTTGQSAPSQSPTATSASSPGQDDVIRHIDAIEAILNGRSGSSNPTPGASANAPTGTTGTTTGNITLNQSQVEEIRMHLAELRKAAEKK